VLFSDPEISAASVTEIVQRSVKLTWDKGDTQVVNATVVQYRATNSSRDWNMTSVGDSLSYIVTALQPGTEYQLFVVIHSYGKTAESQNVTVTTGRSRQDFFHSSVILLGCVRDYSYSVCFHYNYYRKMQLKDIPK